jgi:NADP-dependent aldehyde dehydrogenase
MSSINPVFFLPAALQANPTALAAALHASVTLGCGQFCTNPGLIIVPKGAATEALKAELAKLFAATPAAVMLNTGIHQAYVSGTEKLAKHPQVTTLGRATSEGPTRGAAAVFSTSAAAFLADHALCDEVFGPATLLVEAESQEEMLRLARGLEGQLTATLHAAEADAHTAAQLSQILEHKAGRLIWGGFPTGLEVCHATVHGGPYPATSDGRTTSVGTQAITRFTRLVAWQNYPQSALPAPVQDANPLGIRRLVDGLSVG